VNAETIDNRLGRFIVSDHFNLFSHITQFYHCFIESINGSNVPKMSTCYIDNDSFDILFIIECIGKTIGGIKENLPDKFINTGTARLFEVFLPGVTSIMTLLTSSL